MTWHDVEQTDDSNWHDLRAGKVTGSSIAKIMANYGKAFGEPAKKLAVDIALHKLTGRVQMSNYTNSHMDRGHEQEPLARALYEEEMFYTVTNGGFYDNDLTGCSPDGLAGDAGLIEIKSVIPSVHFKTIQRNDVDPAYRWQCAFNLKESGRRWIDFISYCADYPLEKQLFVCRKTTDDYQEEFKNMASRLDEFFTLTTENEFLIRAGV